MIICMLACVLVAQCGKAEGDIKLGGWQQIPLAEQIVYQPAFDFLLQQANEISSGYTITKVEMQVVAGFNYRFTLHTREYGQVESVIYQDLDGAYDLVYIQPVKPNDL